MSAIAFRPGQRIILPGPHENTIAYFESIAYQDGEPIISYYNDRDELCEVVGYDLLDCKHYGNSIQGNDDNIN